MRTQIKSLILLLNFILLSQSSVLAIESKIKFDKTTYYLSNPNSKTENYDYYTKNENIETWHTKISLSHIQDKTNPTEATAEFAHKIQEEAKGASVLLYPDASMTAFINFPKSKDYYDYNTVKFSNSKTSGLDKFTFTKRFYSSELEGSENARKSAINFAENNTKKYMEMVNKEAPKYTIK